MPSPGLLTYSSTAAAAVTQHKKPVGFRPVTEINTTHNVAIRALRKSKIPDNHKAVDNFKQAYQRQLYVYSLCKDGAKYVKKPILLGELPGCVYSVTKLAPHGDLFKFALEKRIINTHHQYYEMVYYLVDGIYYLHEMAGIYHGDLKMENIVVTNSGCDGGFMYKFIDFEFSRHNCHEMATIESRGARYGTPCMGNDVAAMKQKRMEKIKWPLSAQDVVALGKTFFDVYFGTPHKYGDIEYNEMKWCIQEIQVALAQMIKLNPLERQSAIELKRHMDQVRETTTQSPRYNGNARLPKCSYTTKI